MKAGDSVLNRAKGQEMTVLLVKGSSDGDSVLCFWFNSHGDYVEGTFSPAELEPVKSLWGNIFRES